MHQVGLTLLPFFVACSGPQKHLDQASILARCSFGSRRGKSCYRSRQSVPRKAGTIELERPQPVKFHPSRSWFGGQPLVFRMVMSIHILPSPIFIQFPSSILHPTGTGQAVERHWPLLPKYGRRLSVRCIEAKLRWGFVLALVGKKTMCRVLTTIQERQSHANRPR